MVAIIKERQRFRRRAVSDEEARVELAHEPYKLELIADKGAASADDGASAEVGAGELTIYDNLRRDGSTAWKDLCRGPARAAHRLHPRLRADPQLRRLLAGGPGQRPAAAPLRDGLAEPGGPQGLPAPPGGGGQARPPQARRRAGPVQLPRRARLRAGGLPPQGRDPAEGDGGLLTRSGTSTAGYEFVNTPHITKARPVPHLGSPRLLRRRRCSRRCMWTRSGTPTAA